MEQYQDERTGESLISEIEKSASAKIEQIMQQAKTEAQKILDDAVKTAEEIIRIENEKTQQQISEMEQRAESSIKMELRKMHLEFKKEFVEKVFEKVNRMAGDFRNNPEYKHFLKNAVLEAIEVIDKPKVVIRFSSLDRDYFTPEFEKEITEICKKELKKEVSITFVRTDSQDIGITAFTDDGFIIYENTFSARMKRLYDELYTQLMGEEI
ncbi:MAG: V-type proton ATPase subunit E [bacterium]|nr:V-type proton ATPase subunit E [bacterium]